MSGGHWDYQGYQIQSILENVAEDPEVARRWPGIRQLCEGLATVLYEIEHDMDWDLSGDSSIDDDAAFDRASLTRVLDSVLKACPDEWFPRGKWATIQAVQARSEKPSGS